jgi:hypothetical protein
MNAYEVARMHDAERMPQPPPNYYKDVKKNIGNQMTNTTVSAYVGGVESFDVMSNYMDAAVGVVGQV